MSLIFKEDNNPVTEAQKDLIVQQCIESAPLGCPHCLTPFTPHERAGLWLIAKTNDRHECICGNLFHYSSI